MVTSADETTHDSLNAEQDELQRAFLTIREALTDSMVERLASTAATAMEVVDRLNDESTNEAVHDLIDKLTELHRIGAIESMFEMVLLVHAVRSVLTDSIVERGAEQLEKFVNSIGSDEMMQCAEDVVGALDAAAKAPTQEQGGMLATMRMLSKPESQKSLQFLLGFGEALAKARGGN